MIEKNEPNAELKSQFEIVEQRAAATASPVEENHHELTTDELAEKHEDAIYKQEKEIEHAEEAARAEAQNIADETIAAAKSKIAPKANLLLGARWELGKLTSRKHYLGKKLFLARLQLNWLRELAETNERRLAGHIGAEFVDRKPIMPPLQLGTDALTSAMMVDRWTKFIQEHEAELAAVENKIKNFQPPKIESETK